MREGRLKEDRKMGEAQCVTPDGPPQWGLKEPLPRVYMDGYSLSRTEPEDYMECWPEVHSRGVSLDPSAVGVHFTAERPGCHVAKTERVRRGTT